MELVCTASVTLPYARRRSNFNHAYFQNQPSLNRTRAQPLHQKFLPVLKSDGLRSLPSLFRGKSIVCKSSENLTWVDTKVPELIRPYFKLTRLDQIDTIWLHSCPAFWSIVLAAKPGALPDFKLMGLFHLISFAIHLSNLTSNALIDLEYDKKVERCKDRPLASGEITPLQGWLFWAFSMACLIPLVLRLNKLSIAISAVEQVMWIAYPFMKRMTYWPQAFLGMVMNLGVILGWAAVKGNLNDFRIFLPVYIGGILWTLVYDTIYAHQDKDDDAKAGIKSTAVMFGDSTKPWILGFATVCVGSLMLGGYNAHLGWPFYVCMIPAYGHLLWQILSVDYSNPLDLSKKFISNKWFGLIVFAGMLLGRIVP